MPLPLQCQGLVYDPEDGNLAPREVPLGAPRAGEIIARVTLSSICRSDLHTIHGARRPAGPLILGHEICGTVADLGPGVESDAQGTPLGIGDRVTWSIAASCGECPNCLRGIPQKCDVLFKYGHETLSTDPPLNGGFAEYCTLVPGTAVYKLSDDLPDETAVFANCAVATAAAIVRTAGLKEGHSVLVQGAGLLGLSVAAFCADHGAGQIVVTDTLPERLALAREFGATHVAQPDAVEGQHDVVVEACGHPGVILQGINALRVGGRYVIAGCVFPDATVDLDLYPVITKMLRLEGVHNYRPNDLAQALSLLGRARDRFPFDRVVNTVFPLAEYHEALAKAESAPSILRVALRP